MKTFYNANNEKALNFINTYKDAIYSYLMADPSKTKFNHITTISVSQRNDNNGWANFEIMYNEDIGLCKRKQVRVETNVFRNELIVQTSKVVHILKSDILLFPSENEDSFYISIGNRNWLTDIKFFRRETVSWDGINSKTYNIYNLKNLLANSQIVKILVDKVLNKIVIISNLDFLLQESENVNDTRVWKEYKKYNIDTSHIQFVQYDGKQPNTIFWCTKASRYTKDIASTTKLALYLESMSSVSAKNIYQKINRIYKKFLISGKACSFKIPASKNVLSSINYDQSMFDDKGNIVIYISDRADFDIKENKVENITENIKDYQKDYGNHYRKVKKWIKEHPGNTSFPKKWTKQDLEIALTLV